MIRSFLRRAGPEALVILGAVSVLAVAGFRWVTPLGDHGIWFSDLEAYSRGARLMRDIRFAYGPLSVAVLDALVKPLGARVWSVVAVQFALGLAAAIAIVRFSRQFLSLSELWVASALLVGTVFWIPGEGSLLYPYAPAVSIGFLLAITALGVAVGARESQGWRDALLAGFLGGLAYLTKQEIGAAAALGTAGAWIVDAKVSSVFRRGFVAGAAFVATVATGYAIVFRGIPFLETARRNVLWPFSSVPPGWREQYAGVTGADRPLDSSLAVIAATGALVAAAGAAAALSSRRVHRGRALIALVGGALAAATASGFHAIAPFAAVPVAVAACLFLSMHRHSGPRAPALCALSAAAIPLLTRVGWRGWSDGPFTAIGYSFAIPLLVFAAFRLFITLRPSMERGSERPGVVVAAIACVAILAASVPALGRIGRWPEPARRLNTTAGAVWVGQSWRPSLERVRDFVRSRTTSDADVLFLPETHGLNFLLRRGSPVPGLKMDTGWGPGAETDLISTLTTHPPTLIVVFDESAQSFATAGFGKVYGANVERWIEAEYRIEMESKRHGVPFRIFSRRPDRKFESPSASRTLSGEK